MTDTPQLSEFFSSLQATLETEERVRKIYDRELALEFNPLLHFFPVGENKFSQILSFFLNPEERHGQGALFLHIFLDLLAQKADIPAGKALQEQPVEIRCEHTLSNKRRLDVHLWFPRSKFAIGIENKIWAGDQQGQLKDYNYYLELQNRANYLLLYWTPYGHLPAENSFAKEERTRLLKSGHYRELDHEAFTSSLVEAWMRACQADRVRTFLRDFYGFIQHEINGEKFMGQNDLTADFILQSKERFGMALAVNNAFDDAIDATIQDLKPQLELMAAELGIELGGFEMLPRNERYKSFEFDISARTNMRVSIGFGWDKSWFKDGYFGFIAATIPEGLEFRDRLRTKFGLGHNPTDGYPWLKSFDEYANFSNQTYLDLYGKENKFIQAVRNKLKVLLQGLKEIEAGDDNPIEV